MLPNLHFFDSKTFDVLPAAEREEYARVQKKLGIVDGHPFFLADEQGDYEYNEPLNEFFRYLIVPKRSSPNTWRTYAYYVTEYLDFLKQQSCDWLQADEDLINWYFSVKCNGSHSCAKVEPNTWNLIQTAVTHLYKYAKKKHLISELPYTTRQSHSYYRQDEDVAEELRVPSTPKPPNYISVEHYRAYWRPILASREHAQRNISLIELLLCSGLRISEALGLDLFSIPDPDMKCYDGLTVVPITVIGKRKKKRTIPVSKRILRAIHFYIDEDRRDVVNRFDKKNRTKHTSTKVFLAENGGALSRRTIEAIFQDISAATGIKLTPHGCRHIYATEITSLLMKIVSANEAALRRGEKGRPHSMLGDPLQMVQKLLGHASIETVFIYLELTAEIRVIVEDAVSDFSDSVKEATEEFAERQ